MTISLVPGDDLPEALDQAWAAGGDVVQLASGAYTWPELNRRATVRPGVTLVGTPNGASTIVLRGNLNQCIQTDSPGGTGAYAGIRDVLIAYDPLPPAGSVAILNHYLSRLELNNVRINGASRGILVGDGAGEPRFRNLVMNTTSHAIEFSAQYGSPGMGYIRGLRCQGVSGNGSAAVKFGGAAGWDRLDLEFETSEQHDYGILLGPDGGPMGNYSYITVRGCIDQSAAMNIRLDPYVGHIRKWKLSNIMGQGHPSTPWSCGLYCVPLGGSRVDVMDIVGCSWSDHGLWGAIFGGAASDYSGVNMVGGGADNCGRVPPIAYPSGGSGFTFRGVRGASDLG